MNIIEREIAKETAQIDFLREELYQPWADNPTTVTAIAEAGQRRAWLRQLQRLLRPKRKTDCNRELKDRMAEFDAQASFMFSRGLK